LPRNPRHAWSDSALGSLPVAADPGPVQPILSRAAGIVRERDSLEAGVAALMPLVRSYGPAVDPALIALLIVVAASRRQESRGGHYRSDFPSPRAALRQRNVISLTVALEAVRETTGSFARSDDEPSAGLPQPLASRHKAMFCCPHVVPPSITGTTHRITTDSAHSTTFRMGSLGR
jgi:hypothetical protein